MKMKQKKRNFKVPLFYLQYDNHLQYDTLENVSFAILHNSIYMQFNYCVKSFF